MLRTDNARFVYLDEIVAALLANPGPIRLVAVDGPGGAGKSTFARELSEAAGEAPVIHTDDFAAADDPIDWWPRLLEQVIEPLARGDAARYQRYDWPSETLAEWHTIEPAGAQAGYGGVATSPVMNPRRSRPSVSIPTGTDAPSNPALWSAPR